MTREIKTRVCLMCFAAAIMGFFVGLAANAQTWFGVAFHGVLATVWLWPFSRSWVVVFLEDDPPERRRG